jgi:hypothetical protein
LFLSMVSLPREMDNVLYYHPRCTFSKDLIDGVRRIPTLAASLRTVDVSVQRSRHRIAEVPCVVYEGRLNQGREAFRWLNSLPACRGEGAASDGPPEGSNTRAAVECSRHADSSTLRFVDFNAERPSETMAPEWYCA